MFDARASGLSTMLAGTALVEVEVDALDLEGDVRLTAQAPWPALDGGAAPTMPASAALMEANVGRLWRAISHDCSMTLSWRVRQMCIRSAMASLVHQCQLPIFFFDAPVHAVRASGRLRQALAFLNPLEHHVHCIALQSRRRAVRGRTCVPGGKPGQTDAAKRGPKGVAARVSAARRCTEHGDEIAHRTSKGVVPMLYTSQHKT